MISHARIVQARMKSGETFNIILAVKLVRHEGQILFHGFMKKLEARGANVGFLIFQDSAAHLSIDVNGYIQSCSNTVEAVFGYKPEELLNQKVNILIPPPYNERHDEYMKKYAESGYSNIRGKHRNLTAVHKVHKGNVKCC